MSHCHDGGGPDRDQGFSLIEIIVALGIITILVVSLLPQLITGVKATRTSQLVTQVKAVGQGELEAMRNLPYRVAPDAGPYIDVLDRFYSDMDAPDRARPACSAGGEPIIPEGDNEDAWRGYVANATPSTEACPFEPQDGPFYRNVAVRDVADVGRVAVVTNTQFLKIRTDSRQAVPVTPATDYDTAVTGLDSPPSSQIGVTLTVLYDEAGTVRVATTYTQISQEISSPPRLEAKAEAKAVEILSTDETGAAISLSAGIATLGASLTHASTASADLSAVTARRSSTEDADDAGTISAGAAWTYFAPPAVFVAAPPTALQACEANMCWGSSALGSTPLILSTEAALPRVGSQTGPLTAVLAGNENSGLTFDNTPESEPRYVNSVQPPLVSFNQSAAGLAGCVAAQAGYASAAGYITTTAPTASAPGTLTACAQAASGRLSLIPTTAHPSGLITVELRGAWVSCRRGASPATDYGYQAVVNVAGSTQGPWTLNRTGSDVLPAPETVTLTSGGNLSDYITSWSSIGTVTASETALESAASLPSIITIVTNNLRMDATHPSDVKLNIGSASCSAKDER